jgi:hypothetical protein
MMTKRNRKKTLRVKKIRTRKGASQVKWTKTKGPLTRSTNQTPSLAWIRSVTKSRKPISIATWRKIIRRDRKFLRWTLICKPETSS